MIMKNSIFIKYTFLFCVVFSLCGFFKTAHSSIEDELIRTKTCTEKNAKTFLLSLDLTQTNIAEALRISDSTLNQFLNHDMFGLKVCHHLTWYYTNVPIPLSSLKTFDIDGDSSIEEDFLESKKYILLPDKLKNKSKIRAYLLDLVSEEREESINIISDILHVRTDILQDFLDSRDNAKPRLIYVALRNYYRSERAEKLSELIEKKRNQRESSLSLVDMIRNLSLSFKGYKQIKHQ